MSVGNKHLFIRFHNIPKNEISSIHDGDLGVVGFEEGVSCYNTIKDSNDCYRIILPSFSSGCIEDLSYFIDMLNNNETICYLIKATQVGLGTYGEPIVKNVNIIGKLTPLNLHKYPIKNKLDKSNIQLKLAE